MSILAQLRREFAAFFYSPIGYVLLAAAAILNGIMFLLIVQFLSDPRAPRGAPMQMMFSWVLFWIIVMILTPLVTMRSIAEEKQSGTLETLLTAPISDVQVVVAKYLAALGFYIIMWIPTLAYPVLLARYSTIDLGPVLAGYLGTFGVGAMFVAVGLLCSSLTKNQIIAALMSFGAIMVLFLVGIFGYVDPSTGSGSFLEYMNLLTHMEDFGRGIVDTRHLIYYASVTGFALFCTVQAVQSRRWKG